MDVARLRKGMRALGTVVPGVLIAALVGLVLSDVVARNFFAQSIRWAQELAVILLGATVWLGLVGAAMERQLFGITLFTDLLPPRLARAAVVLRDLLVILIAAAVVRAAIAQIATAKFSRFLALGWPKWIMAALLACGMVLIILSHLLALLAPEPEDKP